MSKSMNNTDTYRNLSIAMIKVALQSDRCNFRFWKLLYTFIKSFSDAECEVFEDGVSAQIKGIKVIVKDGGTLSLK